MNSLSTIQRQDLPSSTAPKASFTIRPNGDVLIAWHPPGQRRKTKLLSNSKLDGAGFSEADHFRSDIHLGTTKGGKVPQRLIDRLVGEHLAPAPTYTFTKVLNGTQVDITEHKQGEVPKVRTLGPRKSAAFLKDVDGITVRGSVKRKDAESRLAQTYF